MNKEHKGLTIFELIVMVVMLSILIIVAAPQILNLQSNAYKSKLSTAISAIKAAVTLFKLKSIVDLGNTAIQTPQIKYNGITGSLHQPWARGVTSEGHVVTNYETPPEIFKAAGIDPEQWSYRIYIDNTYAVIATPKEKLLINEPTQQQITNTQCYFIYHWQVSALSPNIMENNTGC